MSFGIRETMGLDVSGITVWADASNSTCTDSYRATVDEQVMKKTNSYGVQRSGASSACGVLITWKCKTGCRAEGARYELLREAQNRVSTVFETQTTPAPRIHARLRSAPLEASIIMRPYRSAVSVPYCQRPNGLLGLVR